MDLICKFRIDQWTHTLSLFLARSLFLPPSLVPSDTHSHTLSRAGEAPDDDERQGVERFNERLSSSGLDERLTLSRMTAPEKHSEHDDRFNERLSSSGLDERLTLSRMTALETHPVETAEVAAEDLSIEDAGFSFKPKAKANEEQANDDHPMVGIFAAVGDMSRRVTASLRQIGAPPAAA